MHEQEQIFPDLSKRRGCSTKTYGKGYLNLCGDISQRKQAVSRYTSLLWV